MESLFWSDYTASSVANDYVSKLRSGKYFFERWPNIYPGADLFVGDPGWLDAN